MSGVLVLGLAHPLAACSDASTAAPPPNTEGTLFDYATNPWRGAEVAPMSATIQWDVFRDDSGDVLVRMLYDEKETAFAFDCTPVGEGSFSYTDTELTRCLDGARRGRGSARRRARGGGSGTNRAGTENIRSPCHTWQVRSSTLPSPRRRLPS